MANNNAMNSAPYNYTFDVAEKVPESDWQSHADCRLIGTAIFFASDNESTGARQRRERTAKEICTSCQVLIPCRNYALNVGEQHGIWGVPPKPNAEPTAKGSHRADGASITTSQPRGTFQAVDVDPSTATCPMCWPSHAEMIWQPKSSTADCS